MTEKEDTPAPDVSTGSIMEPNPLRAPTVEESVAHTQLLLQVAAKRKHVMMQSIRLLDAVAIPTMVSGLARQREVTARIARATTAIENATSVSGVIELDLSIPTYSVYIPSLLDACAARSRLQRPKFEG